MYLGGDIFREIFQDEVKEKASEKRVHFLIYPQIEKSSPGCNCEFFVYPRFVIGAGSQKGYW